MSGVLLTAAFALAVNSPQVSAPKRVLCAAIYQRVKKGDRPILHLLPVATYQGGKYRSANAILADGDTSKATKLKTGTRYLILSKGQTIGTATVRGMERRTFGQVDTFAARTEWSIQSGMIPRDADKDISNEMLEGDAFLGDVPAQGSVFLAIEQTKVRIPAATISLKTSTRIGRLARALAIREVTRLGGDSRKLKIESLKAFDLDTDGRMEYVACLRAPKGLDGHVFVLLIGNMRNGKFKTLYKDANEEVMTAPLDAFDIDGDGKAELICSQAALEASGLAIIAKSGRSAKLVFEQILFGL